MVDTGPVYFESIVDHTLYHDYKYSRQLEHIFPLYLTFFSIQDYIAFITVNKSTLDNSPPTFLNLSATG